MRLPVAPLLLLLAPCLALAAAPKCTAGKSMFALSGVSDPACLGLQMGNQWSRILVDQKADCSYTVQGNSVQLEKPLPSVSARLRWRLGQGAIGRVWAGAGGGSLAGLLRLLHLLRLLCLLGRELWVRCYGAPHPGLRLPFRATGHGFLCVRLPHEPQHAI
jgi:hypothetical protein